MGRWEPGARSRLASAALALFAERGFDRTTSAEIARSAGLTESSFFRNFPDKREVLFYGVDHLVDGVRQAIASYGAEGAPLDAVVAGLCGLCERLAAETASVVRRAAIIDTSPELHERDLAKREELRAAMAEALHARGVPTATAQLASEIGLGVFRAAYSRWLQERGRQDLTAVFRSSLDEARGAFASTAV